MMYVTALSLGTLIHPGYLAYFLVVLLIMAVANMINAFRLNNEDNLKEMKTAMAVCTFGPIPFYLFVKHSYNERQTRKQNRTIQLHTGHSPPGMVHIRIRKED